MNKIVPSISKLIFNETTKTCLLGMAFFFAGLGIGYEISGSILIFYFILFFGKENIERITANKQAWTIFLCILISLMIFTGILYSGNIKIPAWEKKYTLTLFHLFILYIILVGEKDKTKMPLLLVSFIAGSVSYVISVLFFELFFYSLKYKWEVLMNPFEWEARNTKYLMGKLRHGILITTIIHFVYLLKKTLPKNVEKYLQNEYLKSSLLIIVYFQLGFGVPHIFGYSLPATLFLAYLVIHFEPKTLLRLFEKRLVLYFFILSVSYFCSVYMLGEELFNNPHITRKIYISVTYMSVFLLTSINENWKIHKLLILSFIFGLFINVAIVVAYSAWLDPVEYGYKNLFNPFSNSINNSPIYSNILALGFSTAIAGFLLTQSKTIKLISSITIFLSTMSVLTIMGRTFFLIAILSTIVFSFTQRKNENLYNLLLVITGAVFTTALVYHLFLPEEAVIRFDKMFIKRLENLFDYNNPRYILWREGYLKIIENPSGDFIPEEFHVKTNSFHNLWIDTVKYAGWFPIAVFLFMNTFTIYLLFSTRLLPELFCYCILSLICLLLLAQDVVLESRLLSVLYAYLAINFFLLNKELCSKNIHININQKT